MHSKKVGWIRLFLIRLFGLKLLIIIINPYKTPVNVQMEQMYRHTADKTQDIRDITLIIQVKESTNPTDSNEDAYDR